MGEVRQNAGQGKVFDLIKAKTQQAIMSARDRLAIDLFLATQDAKKIHTMPVLVDATSTVQDINSTTNSLEEPHGELILAYSGNA